MNNGVLSTVSFCFHPRVVQLDQTKIDKNNKALLDLRRRTADEQTKELDKNMESRRESQIVKDQVFALQ